MEFEVEVKVIEEPIISEIILPEEHPDVIIDFDNEMSKELGYKSFRYNVNISNYRLIFTTINDEEIVVPNELVEIKLKEVLDILHSKM